MRTIYTVRVRFWNGQWEVYGTYGNKNKAEQIANKIRTSHPLYRVKVESVAVLDYETC